MESNASINDKQQVLPGIPVAIPVGDKEGSAPKEGAPACKSAERLRTPQRLQTEMRVCCPDDLVAEAHPVRAVAKAVAKLDLSQFYEPIKAREGVHGRDATAPELLVGLWLYATIRGIGSARELARRCQESRPFEWLCGGVSVNHRMLSEFRTGHGAGLDDLLTQMVATLVDKEVVKASRISQDGVRVRVGAGASSFRREQRLEQLLEEAQQHVQELKRQVDSPAATTKRQAAVRKRVAQERLRRVEAAIQQLPELKKRQEEAAKKAGQGKAGQKIREKQPRVSTTDAEARVMKMGNGGFNPAVNVQVATDTESRAIVAIAVTNEGSDSAGLSEPMRQQVEERTGSKVEQHLLDGGYMRTADIEQAHQQGVEVYVPPKSARNPEKRGRELEPKPGDSEAIRAWKQRMASEKGKQIYKQRASTSETVNADLRKRGLTQILVRGLAKAKCVALWCALAYNMMHFSAVLLS